MATGVTTTSQIDPIVDKYADQVLLDRREQFNPHIGFGQMRRLPSRNTKTLGLRRHNPLDNTPKVLSEDVKASLEKDSKFDVDIAVTRYGNGFKISNQLLVETDYDVLEEEIDILSQNMFEMLDAVCRNVMDAGAMEFDASNGVNGNSPTEVTETDLNTVLDYIHANKGKKMTPNMEAVNAYGVIPVERSFWGILHTDIRADIRNLSSFESTNLYARQGEVLQDELGATDEIRWCYSSGASKSSDSPAQYALKVLAQNAYGLVSIDEVSSETIIKPLGAGDDPYNQWKTLTWASYFGVGIIDDGWMAILNVTRSS